MVHVPSLLVGATSSLVAFLAVHEQLDHRSRLSAKWKLTETAEQKLRDFVTQAIESNPSSKQLNTASSSFSKAWNQGITYAQDALRRDK